MAGNGYNSECSEAERPTSHTARSFRTPSFAAGPGSLFAFRSFAITVGIPWYAIRGRHKSGELLAAYITRQSIISWIR